jgi:adenine/guanine phosphoribosyltransferase-like PRPP-binding protein
MKTETASKILKYISSRTKASANELSEFLNISPQATFKHLKKLISDEKLEKIGKPPTVFYIIKEQKERWVFNFDKDSKSIIDKNFLMITSAGERREGSGGFVLWCKKHNLEPVKTAMEYTKTLKKHEAYKKDELIDGLGKLKSTFKNVNLEALFYLDFYSIERFGKTKLGQLLLYAKQSQSKRLIKEIVAIIKPSVTKLIKQYKIDGVGFVPPTVKRGVQLVKELQKGLRLGLPVVKLVKIKTEIIVPQKTLSMLADRVENAKQTIVVDDRAVYKNILLIDDAVGSGATINETAAKIRQAKLCKGKIIGLAITGSFKGFDVISEV